MYALYPDLHSSMDRLKETKGKLREGDKTNLHSSMDRLKDFQSKRKKAKN